MDTSSLVPAALLFVTEVDAAYPDRGRESDGSVASSAHSAGNPNSDHEHGTPAPGDRDIDAVDIDADLVPGDPAASRSSMFTDLIRRFEGRHRAQYWIFQDRISFASEGWAPRSYAYAGPNRNRHEKHCHFNWREDSASHNDVTPYGIEGEQMTPAQFASLMDGYILARLRPNSTENASRAALRALAWGQPVGKTGKSAHDVLFGQMATTLDELAERPATPTLTPADITAIVEQLVARMPEYGPRINNG